jgi:pyruvate/2-oxoglutarate dehydrogenase complex dihydrolipoamide dehydrogenase (E3) component
MGERIDCDIAVIGAGSGGLSVAAGAALLGARTVLVERGRMGGDCLNYGCVPSKAMISAARYAVAWKQAAKLGIQYEEPEIDFAAVMRHVKNTIAAIAPHDSVERFTAMGVHVLQGDGRFTGPDTLAVGSIPIRARRFVIAAGSRPLIPPVEGLADVAYLTNETVFNLTERPVHLLIIGGGPIGIELAQAFRRLDSKVTVIERAACLPREDTELGGLLLDTLREEGVTIRERTEVLRAETTVSGIVLTLRAGDGSEDRVAGSHLLVAAGRQPNIEDLGLQAAGIETGSRGIEVNANLRTTNRRAYAIGDITGLSPFTHTAGYHAAVVLKNILFRIPARADHTAIPRVTYGDPELAAVGLSEDEARAKYGKITILRWPFAVNDRAQTEARTEGLIKAIVARSGRVLGVSIIGAEAGDMLQPWILAIERRLGIGALQAMVVPYPTRGEVTKRAAGDFYKPKLFSPMTRKLVQFLARFG